VRHGLFGQLLLSHLRVASGLPVEAHDGADVDGGTLIEVAGLPREASLQQHNARAHGPYAQHGRNLRGGRCESRSSAPVAEQEGN
jgi:hypothetical protein